MVGPTVLNTKLNDGASPDRRRNSAWPSLVGPVSARLPRQTAGRVEDEWNSGVTTLKVASVKEDVRNRLSSYQRLLTFDAIRDEAVGETDGVLEIYGPKYRFQRHAHEPD